FSFFQSSPSRHDLHDLQPVPGLQLPAAELGWRYRLAVVLHDHAPGQKRLRHQELLDRTRYSRLDLLPIRNDMIVFQLLALPFDLGLWTVDCGLWTVGCGLWTLDFRLKTDVPILPHRFIPEAPD